MKLSASLPELESQLHFGALLARTAPPSATVWLEGDLGAGKTTLVRGLLSGLGHTGKVRSPTYTLLEPYTVGGRQVDHLDLYRLGHPEELEYLGIRDLDGSEGLMLVEWPQRGAGVLPGPDLTISLSYREQGREIVLISTGEIGAAWLLRLLPAVTGEFPHVDLLDVE